jgi:hypothetical protein
MRLMTNRIAQLPTNEYEKPDAESAAQKLDVDQSLEAFSTYRADEPTAYSGDSKTRQESQCSHRGEPMNGQTHCMKGEW